MIWQFALWIYGKYNQNIWECKEKNFILSIIGIDVAFFFLDVRMVVLRFSKLKSYT